MVEFSVSGRCAIVMATLIIFRQHTLFPPNGQFERSPGISLNELLTLFTVIEWLIATIDNQRILFENFGEYDVNLKKLILCTATTGATLSAVLVPLAVDAAPIAPTSYNMPNGDGQASGGTFNYWDANYNGAGSVTTDGAPLSGGLGKLTDGLVSTQPWYLVSNNAGTGEYVGWIITTTPNPVITFNFAGSLLINTITIQMDNTQVGGVFAPVNILIDGISHSFSAPTPGSVGSVSFAALGLLGSSHTIEFDQTINTPWTFVSEISFDGVAAVPEPETYAMLLAGLGLLDFVARRRKQKTA
jgi:hypothetical protein